MKKLVEHPVAPSLLITWLLVSLSLPTLATDPAEVNEQLEQADQLLAINDFELAAKIYRRADRIAEGASSGALLGLTIAEYKSKQFLDAAATARRLLELANQDADRMAGYNLLGLALLDSEDRNPEILDEAEDAFRQVLAISKEEAKMAHFNLASVLQRKLRSEEALYEVREYLRSGPSPAMSDRARIMICDLRKTLPPSEGLPAVDSSSSATGNDGVHEIGDEVQKPIKIAAPHPRFTAEARANRTQGQIEVKAVIDPEGCVVDVEIVQGLPDGLSEQTATAIRSWVFRPATFRGKPVAVYYNLTTSFGL